MGLRAGLLLLGVCRLLGASGPVYQEIMPYFPEDRNGTCFFPFHYNQGLFYECVKFHSKHKWCSLTHNFTGRWKYCSEDDSAKCVFPFWYRRMIYWECTEDGDSAGRKWCSLTQNYNEGRVWKYCDQ